MIAIVDYKMGNLGSIKNMLKKLGHESVVTNDHAMIASASKVILPGVGAFDAAMHRLDELGLIDSLNDFAVHKKMPILGICLGAQLMTRSSDEGKLPGLGWFAANTVSFKKSLGDSRMPVPNIGWLDVQIKKRSALTANLPTEPRFYFVHSYYMKPEDESDELLSAEYGLHYCAALERENVFAVQFHPEKSHKFGFKLLDNFARM